MLLMEYCTAQGNKMKLLMFAASLRQDSCNKKLITLAAIMAQAQKAKVDLANFVDFSAPIFNEDDQNSSGIPSPVQAFASRLQQADALVISSPEYNFSTPGPLKNFIDWVSRLNPTPWKGCKILLMSASPGLVGGNRGLWATRVPLESCGSFIFPDMFSLSSAYTAFNPQGNLNDEKLMQRLNQNIEQFIAFAARK
jgi:chromate reductase